MASEDIIDLYERHAERWVQARLSAVHFHEKAWMDRFCALMPAAATVLDCGCGAGEPIAAHLSARGYRVTGVDSSAAMIRMFRTRLPGQRAFVADMRSLSLYEQFQGILAWDSFFHLNQEDQKNMFLRFRAHAAPGAALMFTSGTFHGEAIGVLEGEPLYHASLDATEYQDLLEEHGFAVVSTVAQDENCGGRTVWLAQAF